MNYEAIQIVTGASSSCSWQKKTNRFLWYALRGHGGRHLLRAVDFQWWSDVSS